MDSSPYAPPDPGTIKVWFAQIYGKIDEMRAAAFAKSGWLFFQTHTHSTEALFDNPTMEAIHALCGQLDSVVRSWQEHGGASPDIVQFYYENRIQVEQRLSNLRQEIISRKPTFWEAILATL